MEHDNLLATLIYYLKSVEQSYHLANIVYSLHLFQNQFIYHNGWIHLDVLLSTISTALASIWTLTLT
jgi:hypothetical protein